MKKYGSLAWYTQKNVGIVESAAWNALLAPYPINFLCPWFDRMEIKNVEPD
jgi:hypothetical protein